MDAVATRPAALPSVGRWAARPRRRRERASKGSSLTSPSLSLSSARRGYTSLTYSTRTRTRACGSLWRPPARPSIRPCAAPANTHRAHRLGAIPTTGHGRDMEVVVLIPHARRDVVGAGDFGEGGVGQSSIVIIVTHPVDVVQGMAGWLAGWLSPWQAGAADLAPHGWKRMTVAFDGTPAGALAVAMEGRRARGAVAPGSRRDNHHRRTQARTELGYKLITHVLGTWRARTRQLSFSLSLRLRMPLRNLARRLETSHPSRSCLVPSMSTRQSHPIVGRARGVGFVRASSRSGRAGGPSLARSLLRLRRRRGPRHTHTHTHLALGTGSFLGR
jgi:hypothetical protein